MLTISWFPVFRAVAVQCPFCISGPPSWPSGYDARLESGTHGFDSRFRRGSSRSSHTSDFKAGTPAATMPGARKAGTPVATMPGARRYGISAGLVGPVSVY